MIKKISIISLGWLGKALYNKLMSGPFEVNGSYIQDPKKEFNSFQYDFNKKVTPKEIDDADIIFLNLPPSKISSKDHFHWFINKHLEKRIIFISSTSVYGDQGEVDESTELIPSASNGKYLKDLEDIIRANHQNFCIIRPGGLYGNERHPGKFLAGKENLSGASDWLNLTGQDDLIAIIIKILTNSSVSLINAINSHHPTKKEFYTQYALKNGLETPKYKDENKKSKKVNTLYPEFEIQTPLL